MQAKQAVQKREGPIRPDWGAKEDRLNGRFWKANDTAKNRVCIHGQHFLRKDEWTTGKRDAYLGPEKSWDSDFIWHADHIEEIFKALSNRP